MAHMAETTEPKAVVHPNGIPVALGKNWLEQRQAMHRFFAELHTTLQEMKSGA